MSDYLDELLYTHAYGDLMVEVEDDQVSSDFDWYISISISSLLVGVLNSAMVHHWAFLIEDWN